MIEAMKKVLETLERSVATCFDQYSHQQVMSQPDHFINQAITSLRQAIAEAEKQEPVAWMSEDECIVYTSKQVDGYFQHDHIPLYTHPQPRNPLTDEQIQDVVTDAVRANTLSWLGYKKDDAGEYTIPVLSQSDYQFARAIEAAHGIKE